MTLFMRAWYIGQSPGQFSHIQLWNRSDSKHLSVDNLVITPNADSSAVVMISSMPLAHNIMQAGAGSECGLDASGAFSTCGEIRFVVDPEKEGGQIANRVSKANEAMDFSNILRGWVVPPQRGLLVRLGSMDTGMWASFRWWETP